MDIGLAMLFGFHYKENIIIHILRNKLRSFDADGTFPYQRGFVIMCISMWVLIVLRLSVEF